MSPTFPANTILKPSSSSSPSLVHATNKRQQQGLRSPLHVLNAISTAGNGGGSTTTCNSASISSDTSSASIDAPRGCLRFFLSHSSSSSASRLKPSSKTPKSTSNVRPIKPSRSRPLKENVPNRAVKRDSRPAKPSSSKLETLKKNSPCLYRRKSGKYPGSVASQKSKMSSLATVDKLASDGEELEKHGLVRMVDDKCRPSELSLCSSDFNFTPLRKMENGSGLDPTVDKAVEENSNTGHSHSKTPPVQASVSPEIQCDSALVPTVTPVCYGAGYVVSGVSDKRKCRPRGVLVVGENATSISKVKPIQNLDNEQEEEDGSITRDTANSTVLKVPSPIEASMNWLLSPCKEVDEDQQDKSRNASPLSGNLPQSIALRSLPSLSSVDALPMDMYSPPEFQGFLEPLSHWDSVPSSSTFAPGCLDMILKEGRRQQRYQLNGENSPFSTDSLSSENVIRTPQSDSSSAQKVFSPWLAADSCEKHDQNSVSELISLDGPKATMSITDLSFQFDCLATISNSMDLNQFQKILDDQAFRNSNSSCEELLKSQTRVSWREGLMSRIYEMDEFDSCRCLSDEEEETADSCNISLSDILETPLQQNDGGADPIVTNNSCSPGLLVSDETKAYKNCKEMESHHQLLCSCAESISTDGGGLVASRDSDWNLCYKNGLFDSLPFSFTPTPSTINLTNH